jgi:hypothetical protein
MLVYSKHNTQGQRFPNEGEITKLIREKLG